MSSNFFEPYDVEAEDARKDLKLRLKLRLKYFKQSLQSQELRYESTKQQICAVEQELKALKHPRRTGEAEGVDTGPHNALSQATPSTPVKVDLPSIPNNQDTPEDFKHHTKLRDEEIANYIRFLRKIGLQPEQLELAYATPSHSRNSKPLSANEQWRMMEFFLHKHSEHQIHFRRLGNRIKFLRNSGRAEEASVAEEKLEHEHVSAAQTLAEIMDLTGIEFRRIYKGLLQCQYAQDENQEKLDECARQRSQMQNLFVPLEEEKESKARDLAKELENEKKRLVKELHDLCVRLRFWI
ncbi:hypothetical protein HYFRA_00005981 [Hymenoscyphus fraxineus]|uniref:Uncharacterized protein n=1 Tax=Hymenoscyphus fraxineus TaxID=746836 RepID=A0A9N9KZL3_9HELO|nr:hypothetical protein HYFRA_00005981 [Hymenoscyphus fraxineus]